MSVGSGNMLNPAQVAGIINTKGSELFLQKMKKGNRKL